MTGKTETDNMSKREMRKKKKNETKEKDEIERKRPNRKVRNKKMHILERKSIKKKNKAKRKPSQILITLKQTKIRPNWIQCHLRNQIWKLILALKKKFKL